MKAVFTLSIGITALVCIWMKPEFTWLILGEFAFIGTLLIVLGRDKK